MKRLHLLAILNFIFFLAAFLISNLSQLKVFSKKDIGEVSNRFDTVFAPAGITFSVWGVIYLSLFAFTIYHLIKAFKANADDEANLELRQIGLSFIVNNFAAAVWVLVWLDQQLIISVILMLIQLITLTDIHIKLGIFNPSKSPKSKLFTQVPLTIYFAWICIATIANISAALVGNNWSAWNISPSNWTIILIGIATLLSCFIILIRRNIFFGLVVIWALYGIVIKRTAIDPQVYRDVITAAWAGILVVILLEIVQFLKNRKYNPD